MLRPKKIKTDLIRESGTPPRLVFLYFTTAVGLIIQAMRRWIPGRCNKELKEHPDTPGTPGGARAKDERNSFNAGVKKDRQRQIDR